MAKTLFDKIWDQHLIRPEADGPELLYIDRHFIHEVTSPQAFDGLRRRNIPVAQPHQTVATADHNVPTLNQHLPIKEALSRKQVATLVKNCEEFGLELYGLGHPFQGIVHVIGPELGITRPGMTIVCGDSHTSTHGAFGAIAFGIGTSEVEQVLATQCVLKDRPKRMRINVEGQLKPGVLAKDIILYIIAQISASGGTGYFVEYAGSAIRELSMEGHMTICNMSIEMGARGGMIAPDVKTFAYLKGRKFAPTGAAWHEAVSAWRQLYSDPEAVFDQEYHFRAEDIEPMITYGTNPGMGLGISQQVPTSELMPNESERKTLQKALNYMGLEPGQSMLGQRIDYVFIGSCTNSRIEDLRLVADMVKGKQKAPHVNAWVVPGSRQVREQAQQEGLDQVLKAAGFELREAGCSACLGMNEDKVPAGMYCVSTSNRNFEGRQGPGARTFLASPLTAAAAALAGEIVDARDL
ncbi:MAG: 3-isopropylmalate dehydratase large subunit [Bacteroidota bacterium]